jgi:hypothetical protein
VHLIWQRENHPGQRYSGMAEFEVRASWILWPVTR